MTKHQKIAAKPGLDLSRRSFLVSASAAVTPVATVTAAAAIA